MKKQNFTHTILYTKNTLIPVNQIDSTLTNIYGTIAKINYLYNIIWVPNPKNGDSRVLRIMPQYKFGCAKSNNDNDWQDALTSPSPIVTNLINPSSSFNLKLNHLSTHDSYTNNIFVNIYTDTNADSLNIRSEISNHSSILSDAETSIYYNMSFRLMLEIYNETSAVTEESSITKYDCIRFGRSHLSNVGESPLLPWDLDPNLQPYPKINTQRPIVTIFPGQPSGVSTPPGLVGGPGGGEYGGAQGFFDFNDQV